MNDVQAEYSGQGLAWATLTSESALPANLVEWRNKQEIGWSLRLGEGASWSSGCGPSQTEVFQTLVAPQCSPAFRTVLYLATHYGGTDADSCWAGTWQSFTGLDVCAWNESDPTYTVKAYSRPLSYWKGAAAQAKNTGQLLQQGDGQCTAWADLLQQCIKANGLTDAVRAQIESPLAHGTAALFYLKPRYPTNPVPSDDPVPPESPWLYGFPQWGPTKMPGQNSPSPTSDVFSVHQIVRRSGLGFYDPSYGFWAANIQDYTAATVGVWENSTYTPLSRFAAAGSGQDEDPCPFAVSYPGSYP